MAYCSHCGRPAEGRFCAACGAPVTPDVVAALASDIRRRRREMRWIAAALAVVLVVSAAFMIRTSRHATPAAATPVVLSQSPPALVQETRTPPAPPVADADPTPQPPPQPQQQPPQVQDQPRQLPPPQASPPPPRPRPALPSDASADLYPGAVPIQVDNVSLPDIGVPVANQVYTTSDSVSAVVGYYQRRYPDATVTDVSGQKVIAIDRPGMTTVIAVGTTGSETRIAIVQPK